MSDEPWMLNVAILPVDQAVRLRAAAAKIRDIATVDGATVDQWSMALAAWEAIIGAPVHDEVLTLALGLQVTHD